MGRSYRDMNFADRDEQLHAEFFSDVEGISGIADVPVSELEPSDADDEAQIGQEFVSVRFNAEGFAEEVSDSAKDSIKPHRKKEPVSDPLEPMPLSGKLGASQFGQDFAALHARAQELGQKSKLSTIRWSHHGEGKRISSKPSVVDFLCDLQITARRVLSPALYKIWHEIYYEGRGECADDLPLNVQITIMRRCSSAWKRAGLMPWRGYWDFPTPESKLGAPVDLLQAVQNELHIEKKSASNKARRKVLRKARRQHATITTAQVAA